MKHIAYIGTDSVRRSKGIYTVSVDGGTGQAQVLSTAPARDSGYLVLSPDGKYLYATIECMIYRGQARAAVAAYRVNPDHSLTYLNEQPSGGQLAAHIEISPDGRTLFVSGYLTGNITVFPIREDGTIAPYSHILQDPLVNGAYPHIHCTRVTPDGKFLCAMEVGTGSVDLYELESGDYRKVFSFATGPVRPRHVTFGPKGDMLYVITEISSEIYVFRYQPGCEEKLVRVQTVRTVPEDFQGMSFSAGIRFSPDGTLLAASTRGPGDGDAVMLFRMDDGGLLTMSQYLPTTGESPRDFNFTPDGAFLLVGLQHSDRMAVYQVDDSAARLKLVEDQLPVVASSCVIFAQQTS